MLMPYLLVKTTLGLENRYTPKGRDGSVSAVRDTNAQSGTCVGVVVGVADGAEGVEVAGGG